ncbi:MAG: ATP-binding protein [Armatimonadetes bacterium]|nr:ATP-binding protein [Armatimonadota bacterium]
MPGLSIRGLAGEMGVAKAREIVPLGSEAAYDATLAWFLRLWLLGQVKAGLPESVFHTTLEPECPYSFFQLVRLVYERGLHEPGTRGRNPFGPIQTPYSGPPLEPTPWWTSTLANNAGAFHMAEPAQRRLVELAGCQRESLYALFPQYTRVEFDSPGPLTGPDRNALRLKMFLAVLDGHPDAARMAVEDPHQTLKVSRFPPESQTREYKSTFRWDSVGCQKNRRQQTACLKAICGMLNAQGGTVVIGVDDSGQAVGLEGDLSLIADGGSADAFAQVVHEAVKVSIAPNPVGLVSIQIQPYGLLEIAVIHVSPSPHRHWMELDGEKVVPVRDGNRTLNLRGSDAEDFLRTRG